jgi:hypothetical protein
MVPDAMVQGALWNTFSDAGVEPVDMDKNPMRKKMKK